MAFFQLYQMPVSPGSDEPQFEIVPARFCWSAFLFGPLWALYHRLWTVTLGWLAAVLALSGLSTLVGPDATFWLYVAGMAWLGFSAPDWRGRRLEKKGYTRTRTFFARNGRHALARAVRGEMPR